MLYTFSKGRTSFSEVPSQQLTIQKHHRLGKASSRFKCYYKQTVEGRILGSRYSYHHGNVKIIIDHNKQILHERRTSITRRKILPLAMRQEDGFADYDDDDDDDFSSFFSHFFRQLNAFYRFSRPHTVYGTLIGVTSVSLLPIASLGDLSPDFFVGLIKALVPSVLMNIYVVGLNQLYDLQIDKVNKPDLPLASGEFTIETGSTIVSLSCLLSFAMGFISQSPPLLMALLTSFLLGSAYSIDFPMLRWKKQAFLAAACIVIVRAVVVQLAFFIHIQRYVLGRPIMLTRSVIFAATFMCFFATVIALFKDIPDVDGDKHFGIQSFTVTLGKEKVFWLSIKMLLTAYGATIALGAASPSIPTKLITVLGHSVLALILWLRAQSVDLADKVSITSFYMFIWKLFYAEYFLVPFIR